jgi:hypothetical protein
MGNSRLLVCALLALWSCPAWAEGESGAPAAAPVVQVDARAALDVVRDAKLREYQEVLAEYSRAQATAPADAALAVSRCRFIDYFTYDDEDWIPSAPQDRGSCLEALAAGWGGAPEVRLHLYEQMEGDEAITEGDRLLDQAQGWPTALRARLLALQSRRLDDAGDRQRARALALQAARLGEAERVPLAVEELVRGGKQSDAVRLLAETPPANDAWSAQRRVAAALTLDDPRVAAAELQRYAKAEFEVDAVTVARVRLHAKDARATRALLTALDADEEQDEDAVQVKFEAALLAGDATRAAARVNAADVERMGENLQRFAVLARHSPASLGSLPMLGMAAVAGVLLLCVALLPGALLLPVHYRGLARKVCGAVARPLFPSVGLRQAWWGLAVMLVVPFLVAGVLTPESVATLFSGEKLPEGDALFRMTLWSTLCCLLVLAPNIRWMGIGGFTSDMRVLHQSGWVLAALAATWAVGFLQGAWNRWREVDTHTLQTSMTDMLMGAGTPDYSPVLGVLLLVVLVPVLEELVFRGLLLGGMSRHIGFGWANLLQALLFAAIHGDPPRFLFYLAMGLGTGALVRKMHSLTPAIALHAINNAMVFALSV